MVLRRSSELPPWEIVDLGGFHGQIDISLGDLRSGEISFES
jgi:hypothetical protein